MEALKNFLTLKHWWNLLGTAGALIAIASAAKPFVPGFLVGLALLAVGVGETMNRKEKTAKETVEGLRGFRTVRVHVWTPTPWGIGFDLIGAALFLYGMAMVPLAP